MILSALFVLAVALEVFLFLGREHLPNARRRVSLAASLRQTHGDLQEARKRIQAARAKLLAAVDESHRRQSEMRDADAAFARSQVPTPTLVHTLGQAKTGACFRAPVSKAAPAAVETAQQTIWSCKNFVDVWAGDIAAARALALRQFPPKRGYTVGEFVEIEPQAEAAPHKAAA